MKGRLFVLSSPSGGGKSTVIRKLRKMDGDLCYSVSATTRPPRAGEKEGLDYFFLAEKIFRRKMKEGAFVEWAKVHGFYYGTLRDQIERYFETGKNILLDIDVRGGLNLKKNYPESVLIFLLPPSIKVLEDRLRKRGTEKNGTLKKRLTTARKEIEIADQYDFQVVNDKLDDTVKEVRAIIQKYEKSEL